MLCREDGYCAKPERGRYGDKRIASFMGYGPASDPPKVAVLVILDEPSSDVKYGGVIAAPVFRAVMQDIFRYMEIPPSYAVGMPRAQQGRAIVFSCLT